MIKDLISVIVPVYNVEKYLPDLFKSLDSQIYKNFEVIFVNDCSTDNSKKLIEEFVRTHKNSFLINHTHNQGLSSTRNTGMLNIRGEYFTFVDSDDMVNSHLFQMYIDIFKKSNVDFVSSNFETVEEDSHFSENNQTLTNTYKWKILNSKNLIIKFINLWVGPINHLVWNKCFKTSLFYKLQTYPKIANEKINLGEDIYILSNYLTQAKSAAAVNVKYYYYRKRTGSISNTKFDHSKINTIYSLSPIITFFHNDTKLQKHIKALTVVYAVRVFNQIRRDNYDNLKDFDEVFNLIKQNIKYCWTWKANKFGCKLMPLLYPMYVCQFKRYKRKLKK